MTFRYAWTVLKPDVLGSDRATFTSRLNALLSRSNVRMRSSSSVMGYLHNVWGDDGKKCTHFKKTAQGMVPWAAAVLTRLRWPFGCFHPHAWVPCQWTG